MVFDLEVADEERRERTGREIMGEGDIYTRFQGKQSHYLCFTMANVSFPNGD